MKVIDGIFDPEADQEKYKFWIRAEMPSKVYSILFTPRSGSSWLTSILAKTRTLGTPEEWFNPELMKSSSQAKGARNLDQFIEAISRHEAHGNIFGFEITHHQIKAVFKNDYDFVSYFPDAVFFWLIRKDIVAQGVSLDKMIQTRVSHASNHASEEIEGSDKVYDYNACRILNWIRHIRAAEVATERMIADFELNPVRLSYEGITSMGPDKAVGLFAEKLELKRFSFEKISSEHRKISTSKNNEFSERFRAENQELLDKIDAERARMLSYVDLA